MIRLDIQRKENKSNFLGSAGTIQSHRIARHWNRDRNNQFLQTKNTHSVAPLNIKKTDDPRAEKRKQKTRNEKDEKK